MAEIMTEAALVVARLHKLGISNDDPIRQTKRGLKNAAEEALREGVNRAAMLLNTIDTLDWDLENAATKEGDAHADT